MDAGGGQRFHLFSRCAFAAGDDRTRVAHPPAGRGGLAGDEANHGLLEVRPDPLGGLLLLATSIFVGVNRYWLWLPIIVLAQIVFVCGVALTTSALDVFIRDIRYVVESACLVLFWMLPIFYGFEAIGPKWAWLYEINPLAAVILIMRAILLDGAAPMPTTVFKLLSVTLIVLGLGLGTCLR